MTMTTYQLEQNVSVDIVDATLGSLHGDFTAGLHTVATPEDAALLNHLKDLKLATLIDSVVDKSMKPRKKDEE